MTACVCVCVSVCVCVCVCVCVGGCGGFMGPALTKLACTPGLR